MSDNAEANQPNSVIEVIDSGTVDGVVVSLFCRDGLTHLEVRQTSKQTLRLTLRDPHLAQSIAAHLKEDLLRLYVRGPWRRGVCGWMPEPKCVVQSFDKLDRSSLSKILEELRSVERNGWKDLDDPIGFWKELRGIA